MFPTRAMITLAEHTCATDCPGNPTFTPGISETSKWRSAQYKLGGRDIHFNIRSIASDTSMHFGGRLQLRLGQIRYACW